MKEVRTRPKERDDQSRRTSAFIPKQAARLLGEQAAKRRLEKKSDRGTEERTNPSEEVVSRFETSAERLARIGGQSAFRSGKAMAQKQFDHHVSAAEPKKERERGGFRQQAEPPAIIGAKQQFRQKRAQQQADHRKEHEAVVQRNEELRVRADTVFGDERMDLPGMYGDPPAAERTSPVYRDGRPSKTQPRKETVSHEQVFAGRRDKARQRDAARKESKIIGQSKLRRQHQVMRETAQKTAQTAKRSAKGIERVRQASIRAGQAVVRTAVGLLGGTGILIALVLVIGGAAAVIGTPFGVFWSGNDSDAQSVPQAVARINSEFSAKISQIQADNPSDSVEIHREPGGGSDLSITNWTDIVAVFAVKTAGANGDATDVVTIDDERIELIRKVFWDMNAVSYHVQTIEHEDSTETILHITITSKDATEMPDIYHFSKNQQEALAELLEPEYAQMLAELVGTYGGEIVLDEAQVRDMLAAMPEDVSAERRTVVEKAYSLLGKVAYFWGGKSSAIGWDSRWGTPTRVTAAGSRTTGTIRPYGLDCSGFVDWVFNNALGYVIGHGGGASAQHSYCRTISWSEALPGDLVFYPGDSHVGVFVGRDAEGNPLIIHCASSQNNVVLTGLQGFTSIGRPTYFND